MLNYAKHPRMESFCPLCARNGIKSRIKAFQINLEEAVWACEAEECNWPIGYEELTFFSRAAISCTWEELNPGKEDISALTELSLYTPPMTPRGELSPQRKELTDIASTEYSNHPVESKAGTLPQCEFIAKESGDSDKLLSFESLDLGSINFTEGNRSIKNEQIAGVDIFKTLPRITNIEKTNINLTIFPNVGEHCNNRKMHGHGHSFVDGTIIDTFKNFDISDSAELGLNMQYKTTGEQSESGKLQSNATVSGVETNFGAETLSETMKTPVDVDVTSSLNATNKSVENVLDSDIDKLLEEICNTESHTYRDIHVDFNNDWLNLLS